MGELGRRVYVRLAFLGPWPPRPLAFIAVALVSSEGGKGVGERSRGSVAVLSLQGVLCPRLITGLA